MLPLTWVFLSFNAEEEANDPGGPEKLFHVFSVPSYPRRQFPGYGTAPVAEFGEVKVVPAAAAAAPVRKLIPHDEAAAL